MEEPIEPAPTETKPKKTSGINKIARLAMLCVIALILGLAVAAIFSFAAKPEDLNADTKGGKAMSQKTEAGGPVKLNQEAPDFELKSESGKTVRLSDFKGTKAVVVYFYPKDDTPGCTAESCAFRDAYEDFKDEGAEVIGISSDSVDSHKSFAEKHKLPFILLSDQGGKVRSQWGVPSTLGVLPGRVSYVIDKKGIVRNIFNSQLDATKHVSEAKKVLAQIKSE
jgi:thioredoxin-dependent peroxiredoxin